MVIYNKFINRNNTLFSSTGIDYAYFGTKNLEHWDVVRDIATMHDVASDSSDVADMKRREHVVHFLEELAALALVIS